VRYQHYKSGIYDLVCEAKLESNPEQILLIYRSPEGETWARPIEAFFEKVEFEGKLIDRFELIP